MKKAKLLPFKYRSRPWFPFLFLIVSVILTVVAAYYVDRVADTKDKLLFDRAVFQTKEAIDKRLDTYNALLRATAGLFSTQQEITLKEFREYTELLEISKDYKGVQGIGYIAHFSNSEKEQIIEYMREQGSTDFAITPDTPRNDYYAILFIEPLDIRNKAALGYDMSSELVRRQAMEKARDINRPVTSSKVTLMQEIYDVKQAGFLTFMPVYAKVGIPQTLEERRALLRGYVYSPFRAGDFFTSIFGTNKQRDIDVFIYDGTEVRKDALLFSTNGKLLPHESLFESQHATVQVDSSGRTWTLYLSPTSYFVSSFERSIIPFILGGGFLVSFLLYFLSRWQSIARSRAEKLTVELLNSQQALKQSERRLRRIIDANVIGVVFADFDGTITDANDAFLKIIGYTKKDLHDGTLNFLDITPAEYKALDQKAMREMIRKGSHKPFEKEYIRKDGTRVPVLVGTAYVKAKKNHGVGLIIDLTERKRLEKQKDEFISIASHELKTPVTSLKAYVQVLAKRFTRQGDIDSAQHLEKMDKQLDKLTNLIKDLLDVTKMQAGKLQFQNELYDLNSLVKEIGEEMQRTTEVHTIVISGRVKEKMFGDKERIGQVIINLLSNAIKYSPKAKSIRVTLKTTPTSVIVSIKDYGVGIPEEMQSKIFDRFYRVSGNKEKTFPGLGLGLYIAAQIIERQGGRIWVESKLNQGSTFSFELPLNRK